MTKRQSASVRRQSRWTGIFIGLMGATFLSMTGCFSYRVPGAAANFRAIGITPETLEEQTDLSISRLLERKPLASFPTSIAVVRVQGRQYRSHTSYGYGTGAFTVVTNRDVESDEAFDQINELPMIRNLIPLNRIVLREQMNSEKDLREAAAAVQADMLLVYTFDTTFGVEEKFAPLSFITLGLFPDDEARVICTVSAALLDTRNGYVYGLAEATSQQSQLANNWTSKTAIDQSRRRAEKEAFEKLIIELEKMWGRVVRQYGPPQADTAAAGF